MGTVGIPKRSLEILTGIKPEGVNKECRDKKKKSNNKQEIRMQVIVGFLLFLEECGLSTVRIKLKDTGKISLSMSAQDTL